MVLALRVRARTHTHTHTHTHTQIRRPIEQDRKSRNNQCTYGQLICKKGGKNTQWRKVSSTSGTWKTEQLHVKE